MALARFRRRMPVVAFVLLALICLAVLGFACACFSDQPAQAIERALSTASTLPPLIEIWSLLVVVFAGATLSVAVDRGAGSRASPILLQRFLF